MAYKDLVNSLKLEEIKRLDAGSFYSPACKGEPVPTLEEVFAANTNIAVEPEAAERTWEMPADVRDILLNKEAIAVNQDPLGRQGRKIRDDGDLEVWSKPLADGGYAVGLFNRGAGTAKITAKWSDVGAKGSHAVRDLWAHKDHGKMADAFSADVPSHGVVMVRIAK